jgi:hypothetical protein
MQVAAVRQTRALFTTLGESLASTFSYGSAGKAQ